MDSFHDTSVRQIQNLSQKDYMEKINELTKALIQAWSDDQRVQAIKIVIQCAKLLSDTSAVPQFYPSQFALIVDVLDTFGRLVYDRLLQKAQSDVGPGCYLSRSFKSSEIPESTKEIARNWFYKIASVRELLPRFYVEAALLNSYQFISSNEYRKSLVRLAEMCRGIGDPLVAIYARCYLCNVGISLDPTFKEHLWRCFNDTMTLFDVINKRKKNDLYQPAMEFIIQCLTYQCSTDDMNPVMEYCIQKQGTLLTTSVLRSVPSRFISESALEWLKLIKSSTNGSYGYDWTKHPTPSAQMLRRIGEALLINEPRPDELLKILREGWKSFMRSSDGGLESYIYCAEVWLEFAGKHFGAREVNTLLDDVIRNIYPDKQYEKFYPQILSMLSNVLRHLVPKYGFNSVLNMEKFVGFLDLLQKEDIKAEASRDILTTFCKFTNPSECDDLLIANYMLNFARVLHDNLTALSPDDEKRQVARLICKTLDRFGFFDDFEQQLTLYVDARGYFYSMDAVVAHLVHLVNTLAVRTTDKVYGRHTRKTASFVRACVAYAFITIPSIMDHFLRLKLYIETASVALINNCLAQADAILKSAISFIIDVPTTCKVGETKVKTTESNLIEVIQEILSLLLIAPDSPELGVLYLFDGLCNAVSKYTWPENSDGECVVLMKCLTFLSVAVQAEYPYSIENVESNDTLYGGDERFIKKCREKGAEIIERILERLKSLGQQKHFKRQSNLCLDLFDIMIRYADLNQSHLLELTVNLWNLSRKYDQCDAKRCATFATYIRKKCNKSQNAINSNDIFWFKLLNKIEGS